MQISIKLNDAEMKEMVSDYLIKTGKLTSKASAETVDTLAVERDPGGYSPTGWEIYLKRDAV